jgi:two-component system cell cycle response regulator DivK
MRILYVEDNPANLFLVQRVARMGNHEIIHYGEGQPALDHFKDDKPDLVLMDIQLPGLLSGLDVVKALRAAGHKTPIVAVTAYAMSGDREKCLEAGCDGYLSKPLPVGELVELFKRHDTAVKPAEPVMPTVTVVGEVKPETVAASPSVTPPVAIEKVVIAPPAVEVVPLQPVIEAPAPVAKRDTSNDETIPSRPTLELKKAESVEAKIETAPSQAVVEVQPVVVPETAVINTAASSPSVETVPPAATTDEKQPSEAPPVSKDVPDQLKPESEKQG